MAAKLRKLNNGIKFSDFEVKISLTPEERIKISSQKANVDWTPFKSRYDKYKSDLYSEFYSYLPDAFQSEEISQTIKHAFDFAFEAHKYQFRKGGDNSPFIIHPAAVAIIVATEIGAGLSSIIAALLHDVVEDTHYTIMEIREMFGETVSIIVDGVTKATKAAKIYGSKNTIQTETLTNMLINTVTDYRVAFIKLSDRLHNMRTMDGMLEGTQLIKSSENLSVFVPIAGILGMNDLKNELETLSFKYYHKDIYKNLSQIRDNIKPENDRILRDLKIKLLKVLVNTKYTCKIYSEEKNLYQIYLKNKQEGHSVKEFDNFNTIKICFSPLPNIDIIDQHYQIYINIIKNFIEKPGSKVDNIIDRKEKTYSSLSFKIKHQSNWVKIEVITKDNDIVAHKGFSPVKNVWMGMNELNHTISDIKNSSIEDMMKRLHEKADQNKIYVFNKEEKIISLPYEATVLDFAFENNIQEAMHSMGAFINGSFQPLYTKLHNSDIVNEILTAPGESPKKEWINWVTTEKATTTLSLFFKDDITSSKKAGEKMFNKIMLEIQFRPTPNIMAQIITHYACSSTDDFFIKFDQKDIETENIKAYCAKLKSDRIREMEHTRTIKEVNAPNTLKAENKKPYSNKLIQEIDNKTPLIISAITNYLISPCCNPIPGDDACAINGDDGMIYIHKRDCKNAIRYGATNGKHLTNVIWDANAKPALTTINVEGDFSNNIIVDVNNLLNVKNIRIKAIDISTDETANTFKMRIKIYSTLTNITEICRDIKNIQNIKKVYRAE